MDKRLGLFLCALPLLMAQTTDPFSKVTVVLSDISQGLSTVVNVAVYVGIILGAVLYAASQLVPDPNEKAKIQSWAWTAVLGAIGALLIKLVGNWIISNL